MGGGGADGKKACVTRLLPCELYRGLPLTNVSTSCSSPRLDGSNLVLLVWVDMEGGALVLLLVVVLLLWNRTRSRTC